MLDQRLALLESDAYQEAAEGASEAWICAGTCAELSGAGAFRRAKKCHPCAAMSLVGLSCMHSV